VPIFLILNRQANEQIAGSLAHNQNDNILNRKNDTTVPDKIKTLAAAMNDLKDSDPDSSWTMENRISTKPAGFGSSFISKNMMAPPP